jgi:hypothetical protein
MTVNLGNGIIHKLLISLTMKKIKIAALIIGGIIIALFFVFILLKGFAKYQVTRGFNKRIFVVGRPICLPLKSNNGWSASSCHSGLKGINGEFYELLVKNLEDTCLYVPDSGLFFVSGIFRPLLSAGYDAVGTVELSSVKRVWGEVSPAEKSGPCRY